MKAVIIAGGEGLRLRPLTCSIPKPLAPLCGKPVIEYILDLLKRHKFSSACVTLGYKGEQIVSHFDGENYNGISLAYALEDEPLGTAGGVKSAVGDDDEVLVISGDSLCDFDLSAAIEFHKANNSAATIIAKKSDDPREYGLILAEKNGRVKSFLEKPSFESCVTDLINTGVYILSKAALKSIPDGVSSDFAQDIFPKMLEQNMPIFAFKDEGYWCDIGDFKNYISCQKDILLGRINCEISGHKTLDGNFFADAAELRGVKVTPPVYIGKNVKISSGAIIDAGSVICDDVTVLRGAKIHNSVLLSGAYIGEKATCNDALICQNAKLLAGSAVFEGGVVGESAVLGENSTVECGVKIWAKKHLESNASAAYDVKYGYAKPICIDDEGVCGETNGEITPQIASMLGSALVTALLDDERIAVGYRDTPTAKAMAFALISGILSAGGNVWDMGECLETEMEFSMHEAGIKLGCFANIGVTAKFRILAENGMPISRRQERKIESGINRAEYHRAGFSDFGKHIDVSSLKELYSGYVLRIFSGKLFKIHAEINSASVALSSICEKVFSAVNDINGTRIIFHIASDGRKLSAYSDETGYVFYEKLLLIACKFAFEDGKNVALPYSAPAAVDSIAEKFGQKVLRYFDCPVDLSDEKARKLAGEVNFPRDGLILAATVLDGISKRKTTLKTVVDELPKFTSITRFIPIEKSPSEVLKSFCSERGGLNEGVVAEENGGRVLIRPVKTGKGVMMFVESFKSETASEICDIYEKLLNEKFKG
ncbi:MAG: sugar phosphate nucleotidyltransferase [Oscillospiraceae bacterium]